MSAITPTMRDRRGRAYVPAVGPWLRPLLWCILGGFALLGATGVYLASVTAMSWYTRAKQETYFYIGMFALHLALGLILIVPFILFGFAHLVTSWKRPNKGAVRYGLLLLGASLILLLSGLLLVPIGGIQLREPRAKDVSYWLHVGTPLVAILLYVRHRLAGPRIRWEWAKVWGALVAVFVAAMGILHHHDPNVARRSKDPKYTFPSEIKLAGGKLIPAETLMADDYCLKCHKDAYEGWYHSAHHFSSFNNKFYLSSVRETRRVAMERDGNTRAARWCAGCHDPVVLASGQFDDPNYNDVDHPTGQAGITCTSCHAITHTNSTRGNGDYTIEEPTHYPFAFSDNKFLQWVNETLVKAKPGMHKRTFLKPEVHRDSKFCSTCHKVGLPYALNHWQDFTRGQNHWDTFLLSGVAGGNARSFYYPPKDQKTKAQCAECHMPLKPSDDPGGRDFDNKGGRKIHDHLFVAANSALPSMRGQDDIAAVHEMYLKDKKIRIDLFALREGGDIEGKLLGPLRPDIPDLKAGGKYLVETVVRTLGVGHPLTQGTVDSNEIWVELIARDSSGKVFGRSGGIGEDGAVDPFSHFINVYMLDRNGKRIDRRNPQDIFVPLYNKQIPPGAGQVVHFGLEVPKGMSGPIVLEAKVNYRKFDRTYRDIIFGKGRGPEPPIVAMASDAVQLPIEGGAMAQNGPSPIADVWQRWNDYGIGLFLEGADKGGQKGELKQAEPIFQKVAELGQVDGWVNLARVYQREGRIPDALAALQKASEHKAPKAPWTVAWLSAQIDERNGYSEDAIAKYKSVLETKDASRGLDFSRDYEVRNQLGAAQLGRAKLFPLSDPNRRSALLEAVATFRKTLEIDSENVPAHHNLGIAYGELAKGAPTGKGKSPDRIDSAMILKAATDLASNPGGKAAAALDLRSRIQGFMSGKRPELESRMTPLQTVLEILGPEFDRATAPEDSAALAATLSATHKALHSMYKPDETAEGRAQKLAREASPAADMNAQSIVIHPLHRPGAPGLSTAASAANPAPAKSSKREDSE